MTSNPGDRARTLDRLRASAGLFLALPLFNAGCAEVIETTEPVSALAARADARTITASALVDDACSPPTLSQETLMTLGHGAGVAALAQSASRIVSSDREQWILWDRASRKKLASGKTVLKADVVRVDLAGDVLMIPGASGVELRDAADGSLRAVIKTNNSDVPTLSPDGRYLLVDDRSLSAMHVWETATGVLRASIEAAGQRGPHFVSDTEQLRMVPYGTVVEPDKRRVQTLRFDTGEVRSSSIYQGEFSGWFRDGRHFITRTASLGGIAPSLSIYTDEAALVQTIPWRDMRTSSYPSEVPVGGAGEHFWVSTIDPDTTREVTRVYRLGTAEPVLKFEGSPLPANGRDAVSAFVIPGGVLRYLDLSGDEPVVRDQPLGVRRPQLFVADSSGRFAYADFNVVYDGSRPDASGRASQLDCGSVVAIAGSTERLVVATSDQTIRIFVLHEGVPTLRAKIDGVDVRRLELGGDGRYLLVQEFEQREPRMAESAAHVYVLDSEGRPHPGPTLRPDFDQSDFYFSVSLTGARAALTACSTAGPGCQVRIFDEGRPIYEARTRPPPMIAVLGAGQPTPESLLSPSGRNLAIVDSVGGASSAHLMSVFEDFTLKTQLPTLIPRLWLDEERILVTRVGPGWVSIVDRTGKVLVSSTETLYGRVASAGPGRFHDGRRVYSAVDGRVLWSAWTAAATPRPREGSAVVGDYYVYGSGWSLRWVQLPREAAPQ